MKHRDTIFWLEAEIIARQTFPDNQYIITLKAPPIAKNFIPGQFVHVRCSESLMLPRPFSIMRVDHPQGTIDLLYKIVGDGTALLSQKSVGQSFSVLGPIGNGFTPPTRTRPLLLGGGLGIPPLIAMALTLTDDHMNPCAIFGSEIPFPFTMKRSQLADINPQAQNAMNQLEELGIYNRLTSLQNYPGIYPGYVTDLAEQYFTQLSEPARREVEVFACGPQAMLKAVAHFAQKYQLPCQVSLEEYMACAIGGCAGCAVEVRKSGKCSMQRVCVDGPVFDAQTVFFN